MKLKSKQKKLVRFVVFIVFLSIFNANIFIQQTAKASPSVDISKQVQLKWIVPGPGDQEDIQLVESSINKYLKDKINTVLDLTTFSWADFDVRMKVYIAAGEQYDINFTSDWAASYGHLASINVYKDLSDMLDEYAPKTKALLGDKLLKGAEVNGKIYALPVYNSNVVVSNGILLNKKLVQKYKINTSKIKKLQDLEPILKTIKSKAPKMIDFYPFDIYSNNVIDTLNFERLSGNSPGAVLRNGSSTKVVNEFETSDAKALFSLMNKWYKAGYIPKTAEATNNYFNNNKSKIFAMYSSISPIKCEDLLANEKIDMVSVQINQSSITTGSVRGAMHAISNMSKNPERALMLLELVNTDANLSNLINYGVEGVHYKKTGTKTISQLPRGVEKYNLASQWVFGNETITYSLPGRTSKAWTTLNENVKKAAVSPLLGFSFDSEPVAAEIQNVNLITNKYLNDLSIGKVNPSTTLTKMNSEMNKAGLKKILDEMQRQVDEFIGTRDY